MLMTQSEIAARIPHQGSMCLLQEVHELDEQHIVCATRTHLDAANPLRENGRMGAALGIEYAAQAMALHCALQQEQGERPRGGYLTSVRDVQLHAEALDASSEPLTVRAERISASEQTAMYQFTLRAGERLLVQGRMAAVLDVAATPQT